MKNIVSVSQLVKIPRPGFRYLCVTLYLAVFTFQKDTHKPKMAQICQKYTKPVQKWSKSYSVLIPPPLGFLMDKNRWADRKLGLNSNLDL